MIESLYQKLIEQDGKLHNENCTYDEDRHYVSAHKMVTVKIAQQLVYTA